MKKSELQSLINECIGEVLNEAKAAKKKEAIKEIKRIIAENELTEADIEEGFLDTAKAAVKKVGDIGKQTLGISSPEDKAAAEKSYNEAKAKAGYTPSKDGETELMRRAKASSYLGKFEVKDIKGKKVIQWNTYSAAPKASNTRDK
jgi:uncharacterized protein with ParB-like and HNH nuclease domain